MPRGDPPDEWLFTVGEAMKQGASDEFDISPARWHRRNRWAANNAPVSPLSVPEIFDRSVTIVVRSAVPIVAVGLVYGVIPTVVIGTLGSGFARPSPASLALDAFDIATNAMDSAALVAILARSIEDEPTTVREALRAGIRFAKTTILTSVRIYVAALLAFCGLAVVVGFPLALVAYFAGSTGAGALLCFIPLFATWALVTAVLVFAFFVATSIAITTSVSSGKSLKLARRYILAKTQRMRAIGLTLGSIVPAALTIGIGIAAKSNAWAPALAIDIAESLTLIAGTAYAAANAVVFTRDARIRLEGLDLEMRAVALVQSAASQHEIS